MRRLVLVCLVAVAASQAAGCIISSDDDGPGDLAIIEADWSFGTVGGANLQCPPGFDTVEVVATGPENITDLYDCVDGTSGLADYIPGDYDITIIVTNDARTQDYASSLTFAVDVTTVDGSVAERFIDDGGRAQVGVDTQTAETCSSAAVDGVGITFTLVGPNTMVEELFDCVDAADGAVAITDPLLSGDYVASISAINPAGQGLGPATNENITITEPNGYADLVDIRVDVD
jgi:hypothetical protein